MTDQKAALEAIGAAHQARADIWTALHTAEHQLTEHSGSPNLSVVRTALEQALEACTRTKAAIDTAQRAAGPFADVKFD